MVVDKGLVLLVGLSALLAAVAAGGSSEPEGGQGGRRLKVAVAAGGSSEPEGGHGGRRLKVAVAAGGSSEPEGGHGGRRLKRADDYSATEAELQAVAQRVTQQEAETAALKTQLTQLQTALRESRAPGGGGRGSHLHHHRT